MNALRRCGLNGNQEALGAVGGFATKLLLLLLGLGVRGMPGCITHFRDVCAGIPRRLGYQEAASVQ